MSDQNGLKQTPFKDAWPTPDVGGTGLNGLGGGLDMGAGGSGIIQSPFSEAIVPTPSGACTPVPDFGGTPPSTIQIDGGNPAGSQMNWDITTSRNTVDKK